MMPDDLEELKKGSSIFWVRFMQEDFHEKRSNRIAELQPQRRLRQGRRS